MADFNPRAENHPCMGCAFGGMWMEMGKPAGNVCKHPITIRTPGLYYGRYHTQKKTPAWCPIKAAQHEE